MKIMKNRLVKNVNQKLIWGGAINPYNIREYINIKTMK